jgi:hypothetical protein
VIRAPGAPVGGWPNTPHQWRQARIPSDRLAHVTAITCMQQQPPSDCHVALHWRLFTADAGVVIFCLESESTCLLRYLLPRPGAGACTVCIDSLAISLLRSQPTIHLVMFVWNRDAISAYSQEVHFACSNH